MKKRLFTIFFSTLLVAIAANFTSCDINTGNEEKEKVYTAEVKYTVTYSSLVGAIPSAFQVKDGEKLTEEQLPELKADGYDFKGWFIGQEPVEAGYVIKKNITIVAKWTPKTFKLSFDANEGTGTTESQTYIYNVLQGIGTSNFTAPIGYYFYNWNTKADGTGLKYFPGDKIKLEADLVLYAIYVEKGMHPITYVSTIECTNTNPSSYKEKDDVVIANPSGATGYTFDGWYETSDFSSDKVTGWNKGTKAKAVVLYAKWNPVSFKVSFNANQGLGTVEAQTFEYGVTKVLNSNAFTKNGYVFTKWNTKADGTGTDYSSGISTVICSVADITLYAQWAPISYSIAYVKNNGNLTNTAENTYTIESDDITLKTPERFGYTFDGWYTTSDFTGSKVTKITKGSTGDVILYAKWSPTTYTITFNANGAEGAAYTQSFEYDEYKQLIPVAFTKTGYNFVRWDTKADGTGTSYGNEKYYKVSETSPADVTLYAIWSIDTYYITYELLTDDPLAYNNAGNIETFKVTDADFSIFDPVRAGYTFEGWYTEYDEETNVYSNKLTNTLIKPLENTNNINLYAKWAARTDTPYYVIFMLENEYGYYYEFNRTTRVGSTDTKPSEEDIKTAVTTISGYDYIEHSDMTIKGDSSEDLILYYNRKTIVYKFITGGAHFYSTDIQDNMIIGKYNQPINVGTPILDGAYFNGWVSSLNGNVYTSAEINRLGYENDTFTAKWTKASIVNISMSALSDITIVSNVEGNTVTLTADSSFDKYVWSDADGICAEESNVFTIDTEGFIPGVYEYFVEAYMIDEDEIEIANSRRMAAIYINVQ